MWRSATLLILPGLAGIAYAHHSQVGIFDSDATIEVTGVVKSVSWRNPHGRILLDVTDEDGNVVEWDAETASISILRNRGVETPSIAIGDTVTLAGASSVRNRPEILTRSILLPTDYEFTFGSSEAHFPAGQAGRIVGRAVIEGNVEEALASADGIFRVWSTDMGDPEQFPMFKGGYPLSETGQAGWDEWDPHDNILLRCGTKGQPLIMITPLPIEFVRDGDVIVMHIEEFDSIRRIHMSPDAVPPAEHTLMGFSRGQWDGATLVVETDHIAAGYFDYHGVPQSDRIRTVERFTPSENYDRLDYSLTTTDPVNFTETFTLTRHFVWKPENNVHPYECLERY